MVIDIQSPSIELSQATRAYIQERALFRFSRHDAELQSLTIHIADINGPKGGIDKHCHISLSSRLLDNPINVNTQDNNLLVAVDKSIIRARSAYVRATKKQQRQRKLGQYLKHYEVNHNV